MIEYIGAIDDFLQVKYCYSDWDDVFSLEIVGQRYRGKVFELATRDGWTSSNGWTFRSCYVPEIVPDERMFFLRGAVEKRDNDVLRQSGVWEELKEAIIEFNRVFRDVRVTTLEDQFFADNPVEV